MNRSITTWGLAALLLAIPAMSLQAAEKPLKVVATVSSLGELVKAVGAEHVDVHVIVPPRLNPHYVQPKPSDVLKVKRADLFVYTGLHLELWLGPLMDAVGEPDVMPGGQKALDMSQGIQILEVPHEATTRAEGEMYMHGNPHYWLDPRNAKILGKAIVEKLREFHPEHEAAFQTNLDRFLAQLDQKITEWQVQVAPYKGRELVAYHNEWPYFTQFTGFAMREFLEPKPGIPPTPRQLHFIEGYIQENRIPAIVKAGHEPKEAAHEVAKRTSVPMVVLCHTVGELPECSDYFKMFDHNITQLTGVLAQGAQQ